MLAHFVRVCVIAVIGLFVTACSDSDSGRTGVPEPFVPPVSTGTNAGTLFAIAAGAGNLTTLVTVLEATGLDATLSDETRAFTVFAPSDDAFDVFGLSIGQNGIDALLADTDTLSDLLLYHVIADQAVDADTAISLTNTTIEMANGDIAALTLRNGELFINEARVEIIDVVGSNGIIHVIDQVIFSPGDSAPAGNISELLVSNGNFTTLVAVLQATGLDATLADEAASFTVFAPTDDAFDALGQANIDALLVDLDALRDILRYHVVVDASIDSITATSLLGTSVTMANGDSVAIDVRDGLLFVNDAELILTDVPATNGVIHVIDTVLIPPVDETGSIIDVAAADGSFTTLLAALEATGLDTTLADETATYTLFAPTDDAFALLGQNTIDGLLADTDTLSDILLYHVIADQAVSLETVLTLNGSMIEMANGDSITITTSAAFLQVNESLITLADVAASNGVIHVIDAVLTPPQ